MLGAEGRCEVQRRGQHARVELCAHVGADELVEDPRVQHEAGAHDADGGALGIDAHGPLGGERIGDGVDGLVFRHERRVAPAAGDHGLDGSLELERGVVVRDADEEGRGLEDLLPQCLELRMAHEGARGQDAQT